MAQSSSGRGVQMQCQLAVTPNVLLPLLRLQKGRIRRYGSGHNIVLQVLNLKRFATAESPFERYELCLSDSVHSYSFALDKTLHHLVKNGTLVAKCILCKLKFNVTYHQGGVNVKRVVFSIVQLQAIRSVGYVIGSPVALDYSQVATVCFNKSCQQDVYAVRTDIVLFNLVSRDVALISNGNITLEPTNSIVSEYSDRLTMSLTNYSAFVVKFGRFIRRYQNNSTNFTIGIADVLGDFNESFLRGLFIVNIQSDSKRQLVHLQQMVDAFGLKLQNTAQEISADKQNENSYLNNLNRAFSIALGCKRLHREVQYPMDPFNLWCLIGSLKQKQINTIDSCGMAFWIFNNLSVGLKDMALSLVLSGIDSNDQSRVYVEFTTALLYLLAKWFRDAVLGSLTKKQATDLKIDSLLLTTAPEFATHHLVKKCLELAGNCDNGRIGNRLSLVTTEPKMKLAPFSFQLLLPYYCLIVESFLKQLPSPEVTSVQPRIDRPGRTKTCHCAAMSAQMIHHWMFYLQKPVTEPLKEATLSAFQHTAAQVGPLLYPILNRKNHNHICAFCAKLELKEKFKMCKRCKSNGQHVRLYFCSFKCQVCSWSYHRNLHKFIVEIETILLPST